MAERAARLGERLKDGLHSLQAALHCIGDVRGRGLLLGLDLVKDRSSKTPDPELAQQVARECLELGMMTSVVRAASASSASPRQSRSWRRKSTSPGDFRPRARSSPALRLPRFCRDFTIHSNCVELCG